MRFLTEGKLSSSIRSIHLPEALLKISLTLLLGLFCLTSFAQSLSSVETELATSQSSVEAINQDGNAQGESTLWGVIIGVIVVGSAGSVAYLCYFAMHVWQGHWKKLAFAPLAILGAWLAVITIAKLLDPQSHSLWAFEIFAWAMIALIYLVLLMTAKRTFEKSA